jgi:carbon monoxide dehydrogenase subunit G
MASVHKEIAIEAPAEHVWAAVRDVGAVHQRLTPGILTDARLEGDERILTFARGGVVRELIVAIDDGAMRLAYAVVEGSQRTTFHHASMQVFADGEGNSRLVWITDFLPHNQAVSIGMIIERGAEVMKQALESAYQRSV